MSKTYIAANAQTLTDDMIDRWCESYEQGEFPAGEHTVGNVVHGRPPLSAGGMTVITIKVPIGMKKAIESKAQSEGLTTSAFARSALVDKLLAG